MQRSEANTAPAPDPPRNADRATHPRLSTLRAVLALGYGGLLALLIGSGVNALQTLRSLHESEELARNRSLERRRVLTTVVLSASVYTNNVERILLSETPLDDPAKAAEVL